MHSPRSFLYLVHFRPQAVGCALAASPSGPAPTGNRSGPGTRNGPAPPAPVPSQNFARSQEPPPYRGTLERFTVVVGWDRRAPLVTGGIRVRIPTVPAPIGNGAGPARLVSIGIALGRGGGGPGSGFGGAFSAMAG